MLRPLCTTGLTVATLFFAFSLTPSLVPRPFMAQGLISGLSFTAGYALGVGALWLWGWLGIPQLRGRVALWFRVGTAALCVLVAMVFLWRAAGWQNDLRGFMGMPEDAGVRPFGIGLITVVLFVGLLCVARLFRLVFGVIARQLRRVIPPRIAHGVGLVLAFMLFWSVGNGVLFSMALRGADTSYHNWHITVQPEQSPPADPQRTGSDASLISWEDLGQRGRDYIAGTPSGDGLEQDPIRVYVGLGAAETPEERAALAVQEMQRVGAFERSTLLLVTPTGTGWVDPVAQLSAEYLLRGDVASVTAQYSYLPSFLALLVESEYGKQSAQALFQAVYGHWRTLPRDERPDLYLYGLSLGALNSSRAFDAHDIIGDPFHGALWSGPPFRSEVWRDLTAQRRSSSPAWLPRFRDGSVIRFMNQDGGLERGDAEWGAYRIAYLQYASDPVTFFSPDIFWRSPEWLNDPRGPDVSPALRWFPVVTGLQVLADIWAGDAPRGYGHEYSMADYITAWHALMAPDGWDEESLAHLRETLEATR
ncbi:alpha/beta-hydrolase family protein [Alcanivorax sp. JB21]|uniref:alpha/beta hydrolase n=1 Tax=Alcanivorax limicola TaxID=2874102 RepID=UPI001CBEF751|nr:alpha/beta-hydrolase family protein [Alcanivorax limicola]MBZ2189044.1 alpha/beta-hydrolase family protein [Alcanivorax limicola]